MNTPESEELDDLFNDQILDEEWQKLFSDAKNWPIPDQKEFYWALLQCIEISATQLNTTNEANFILDPVTELLAALAKAQGIYNRNAVTLERRHARNAVMSMIMQKLGLQVTIKRDEEQWRETRPAAPIAGVERVRGKVSDDVAGFLEMNFGSSPIHRTQVGNLFNAVQTELTALGEEPGH